MAQRLIKRINYKEGEKLSINYQIARSGDGEIPDEVAMSCGDEPRVEFVDALTALRDYVPGLLEQPMQFRDGVTVRGVSFQWQHGQMGAMLNCTKRLSHAAFNFNTPRVVSGKQDGSEEPANVMPDEMIKALEVLLEETGKYIDGERKQMQLLKAA